MTTALITGVTGQDGSYLSEWLLANHYRVIGAVANVQRAAGLLQPALAGSVKLVEWDMLNQDRMAAILMDHKPDEIYNLAAHSSGAGMYDDPIAMGEVNGLAVARMLEAIRKINGKIRFCQASSSEMFGNATETPQYEKTQFHPRSPYGAAKLYAHSMVNIYRRHYNLFACSAVLFNHESPRRGLGFVTRKITHAAAKIKLGLADELHLGSLDALRDWGFAGDYVRAMWLMLQQPCPDDYVLATGEAHSVREVCEVAFEHLGLCYHDYVLEDSPAIRPIESVPLLGNSGKARKQLAWLPTMGFREMVRMMVDADLQNLIELDGAQGHKQ